MKRLKFYEAAAIAEATIQNGGYSFEEHNSGYMVSLYGTERVISLADHDLNSLAHEIQRFFEEYQTVNTWIDDGSIYLDVSVNMPDLKSAKMVAEREEQLAIYDCKTGKTIRV